MCILNFSSSKRFSKIIESFHININQTPIIGCLVDSACLHSIIPIQQKFTFIVFINTPKKPSIQILKTTNKITKMIVLEMIESYNELIGDLTSKL